MAKTSKENDVHLSFDRCCYFYEDVGPCQLLARSFHSPGVGYCVMVSDSTGAHYYVPVQKSTVKDAMEKGVYVWVDRLSPVNLSCGAAINLLVAFSEASYTPLYCSTEDLLRISSSMPYYDRLKTSGTRSYRFNPRIGLGSNVKREREEQ